MITMRGGPTPEAERIVDITRPGVDGAAYKKIGKRADRFEMMTMSGSNSAANAWGLVETYRNLVGTLVTLVDDHDVTWNNVAVHRIANPRVRKVATPAGGTTGMTHAVFVRWEMQLTEDKQ